MAFAYFGHDADPVAPNKDTWGGKGAGLLQMSTLGLNVPPGFVIPTTCCLEYEGIGPAYIDALGPEISKGLDFIGAARLYSVRSGAPISMPGMMDTILNVGISDSTLDFWSKQMGPRAARDCYRRLIQMLGATAYGINPLLFEKDLAATKAHMKVKHDHELSADALSQLIDRYKQIVFTETGKEFPQSVGEQVRDAVGAVFRSWHNPRAKTYREINGIDHKMGTACVIQAMVFGNINDQSGTGVLFSRNPSTGEPVMTGEFLVNAQGEDVVAGIRTPMDLIKMADAGPTWGGIFDELLDIAAHLEDQLGDMVDLEFTVEDGALFILQCRVGKRSALAAFVIAHHMFDEKIWDAPTMLSKLSVNQFKIVSQPIVSPDFKVPAAFTGLPGCPGVAFGRPVFSSEDAVAANKAGENVVLVTPETDPDDLPGMHAAVGILTATGGATSHAAVVARAMDKPCVVGCGELDFDAIADAKAIVVCGSSGRVWLDTTVTILHGIENPAVQAIVKLIQAESGFAKPVSAPNHADPSPQRICCSHFWGEATGLAEVIANSLQDACASGKYTIDVTPPGKLCEDAILTHRAFAQGEDEDAYLKDITAALLNAGSGGRLEGLRLVGGEHLLPFSRAALLDIGIRMPSGKPSTVADLLAGATDVDDAFILNVLGGQATLDKLLPLVSQEAISITPCAPADYLVFSALAGDHVPVAFQGG